jgi:hypothetical protein
MHTDLVKKPKSPFLSCEKDLQLILEKLFFSNKKYGEELIRYLVINTSDCLDRTNEDYNKIIKDMSLTKLKKEGYIKIVPKLSLPEHEEIKSYIIVSFDNFTPNIKNPQYRDCTIHFDVICHADYWDLGNFELRPIKICGYIDSLLNNAKLTGIGELNFLGCNELILNENLSGYSLVYEATHGNDDKIPGDML